MQNRIAVIGMGQMGSAMAERLSGLGHDVTGFDISAAVRDRLLAQGVSISDSLAAAVHDRDVILTSLPNPSSVTSVFLGDAGLIALAQPGSLIIELSTIDPDTMKRIGEACRRGGFRIIDCPVSGRPSDGAKGTLSVLAGGSEDDIGKARPLLEALGGKNWHWTGDLGTAKVVKIVNNMMSLGNVLVAAEAFAVGTAAGVEPKRLYEVLSVCGGRSHHFNTRFAEAIKGNWEPGFKMELGEKDLALGVELARSLKLPAPAASLGHEMYALALAQGYRGKDIVSMLAMYRAWFEAANTTA